MKWRTLFLMSVSLFLISCGGNTPVGYDAYDLDGTDASQASYGAREGSRSADSDIRRSQANIAGRSGGGSNGGGNGGSGNTGNPVGGNGGLIGDDGSDPVVIEPTNP